MEKISWTDSVLSEEGLQRVKEERNILHTRVGTLIVTTIYLQLIQN